MNKSFLAAETFQFLNSALTLNVWKLKARASSRPLSHRLLYSRLGSKQQRRWRRAVASLLNPALQADLWATGSQNKGRRFNKPLRLLVLRENQSWVRKRRQDEETLLLSQKSCSVSLASILEGRSHETRLQQTWSTDSMSTNKQIRETNRSRFIVRTLSQRWVSVHMVV